MKNMPLHILLESWPFMIRMVVSTYNREAGSYLKSSRPVYLQLGRQVEATQRDVYVCVCVCVCVW